MASACALAWVTPARSTGAAPTPAPLLVQPALKPGKDAKPGSKAGPKATPKPSTPKTSTPKASPKPPDPKARPAPEARKPEPAAHPAPVPQASKPGPAAPTVPAPADPPIAASTAGGYWLSARLLGSADARSAALEAMSLGTGVDGAPDAAVAGQVQTLPEAIAWVARWAFTGAALPRPALDPADVPLHEGPAPIPGGPLFTVHGAVVHALIVRGRNVDGSVRAIRWPQPAAEVTPPDLPWSPAALLAERAPLFAAPAARVPPAAERFALVRRSGHLWVLGLLDRCSAATGERVCLRWAQVVARDGDEFRAGYLPAHQLALVDGWRRGPGSVPRAQLIASGTVGGRAQFLLVARTRDGGLHRRTLEAPLRGDAYPAARLRVDGEWATVEFAGAPAQRVALDATLDARAR